MFFLYVKYNLQLELRQKSRKEKGETYDPICFSNIELDDEWIIEKENPCLFIHSSWMDVHECFYVEEAPPNQKKEER